MPTPFMHLALVHRLRHNRNTPREVSQALWGDSEIWAAFLLGSIAPDARLTSGTARANTHFYRYGPVIDPRPASAMLAQYPDLNRNTVSDAVRRAFLAGYLGHLTMDEVWCVELLFPHFVGESEARDMLMQQFHMLIGALDDRDRNSLPVTAHDALANASPSDWLPFIGDEDLKGWRDVIACQLAPGGQSQSLDILGRVIGMKGTELGAIIADKNEMDRVWTRLTPSRLEEIETRMFSAVAATIRDYLCS